MSEHEREHEQTHPHEGTLPEGSEPEGATQTEKPYSDFEGEKGGKGGDHPTPGAGEHDAPNG